MPSECLPAVPGSGPVQRERRDVARQAPRTDGRRATDPALTTADVGRRLGVSTNFVVGEIQDGRLEALVLERPGARRVYRVTPLSLQAYLERYRWQPPARKTTTGS